MNWIRIISILISGNALLIGLFLLSSYFFGFESLLFNILGSSLIFAILTFIALYFIKKGIKKGSQSPFLVFTGGIALVRLIISFIWVLFVKEIFEPESIHYVIEFILIYVYYLVMDTYFLSRIVKK